MTSVSLGGFGKSGRPAVRAESTSIKCVDFADYIGSSFSKINDKFTLLKSQSLSCLVNQFEEFSDLTQNMLIHDLNRFRNRLKSYIPILLCATLSMIQAGCATDGKSPKEVSREQEGKGGSFFNTRDIDEAAAKIANRLVETPRIMNAKKEQYILVDAIKNQTRFPELTRNDAFIEALITELSKRKEFSEKVFFINRERAAILEEERKKKESGGVSGSSDVDYAGADFLLTGKFMDTATSSGKETQVRLSYLYTLLDVRRQIEVFRDSYDKRREGQRDSSYR